VAVVVEVDGTAELETGPYCPGATATTAATVGIIGRSCGHVPVGMVVVEVGGDGGASGRGCVGVGVGVADAELPAARHGLPGLARLTGASGAAFSETSDGLDMS